MEEDIDNIKAMASLKEMAIGFIRETAKYRYSHHFMWLGRSIIQFPQDIVAIQELIWRIKPDLIIETGIAYGGSLIFSASMLELIGENGSVLGIDVDIKEDTRREIENHPMYKRISMVQGSSIDEVVAEKVWEIARNKKRIFVMLDSNHTHAHVLKELELYSPLVSEGSYIVVLDTTIEDMPEGFFPNRIWGKGNNPRTAIKDFLRINDRFVVDEEIGAKLLITASPDGYLRCIKD